MLHQGGTAVDQETMLHHLEELAEKVGIDVRYEPAAGRVGVAVLRGKRIAVIDANLRVNDRVAALSSILADEPIGDMYVPPAVRKRVENSGALRVRPDRSESDESGDSSREEDESGTEPGDLSDADAGNDEDSSG
jgi:hypothetical protein